LELTLAFRAVHIWPAIASAMISLIATAVQGATRIITNVTWNQKAS